MPITKHKVFRTGSFILLAILLLALAYTYQRSKFIRKANTVFDPAERAFTGIFVPWPIGHSKLLGNLDSKTDSRIRASLGYESGEISSNGMTLIIYNSDGTFIIYAN